MHRRQVPLGVLVPAEAVVGEHVAVGGHVEVIAVGRQGGHPGGHVLGDEGRAGGVDHPGHGRAPGWSGPGVPRTRLRRGSRPPSPHRPRRAAQRARRPAAGPRWARAPPWTAASWRRSSSWWWTPAFGWCAGGAALGFDGPELQDASATAARATVAPHCRRRSRVPRIGPVWPRPAHGTVRSMVTTRDISYEADGRTMIGTLALPDGTDQRPGVLVCHEGPGLDDHGRGMAVRLAELGYVAFALDYHGGGQPLADREQMMARIGEFYGDPLRVRAIGTAGLAILRDQPRVDTESPGRHRLLLRRDPGFRAGPRRGRPQGGGGLPRRPGHGAPGGRVQHHGRDPRPHRGRRPHRRQRAARAPSRRR